MNSACFSSTVIPTVNRPTLSRAVASVLRQEFAEADFEVIVVNDSGKELAKADWQASPRVRVVNTDRVERSRARNAGAALARGKFLHFLDDDDRLVPGAFQSFWELAQASRAQWLYGAYRSVDNAGSLIAEFRPSIAGNVFGWLVAGESLPLQASLIDRDLFYQAGAFDSQFNIAEDRDLGRRLALRGTLAATDAIVVEIRVGERGSSTAGRWHLRPEKDREGREKALREQGAFARARLSASTSYLRGRVSRAYFASMLWNARRKRILVAFNRGLAGMALAGGHLFRREYWRGVGTRAGRSRT